ncbi:hypothetical protein ACQ4PT_018211 [Festuca glaucescens]
MESDSHVTNLAQEGGADHCSGLVTMVPGQGNPVGPLDDLLRPTGCAASMVMLVSDAEGAVPGDGVVEASQPRTELGRGAGVPGGIETRPAVAGTKATSTYSRAKKNKEKPLSVRKSSRHTKTVINISSLEKAKSLTVEKNLDSCMTKLTALDSLPDSHLSGVLEDSCIIFNPSRGSPSEILGLVRARELAQASLAESALRLEREAHEAAAREAAAKATAADDGTSPLPCYAEAASTSRSKPNTLDAWVGLHKDGYICSCRVASRSGAVQPNWKIVKEKKLFRSVPVRKQAAHDATLTYMGNAKFCIVESVVRDEVEYEDAFGDRDGCMLLITKFGIKYSHKGELQITSNPTTNYYPLSKYIPSFSPTAFWK